VTHPPESFQQRIARALGDEPLRAALDVNTRRKVEARQASLGRLADADRVRDHARRIRAHTLSRLDHYLAEFTDRVEQHGGTVFWAATAADAVRYIVDVAKARGVRSIVKSKSMVSEEIELNPALEAAGMRVVETDLGEWVVQLDHDRPSHIVAPIMHKSRADIAKVFRREAGATDADLIDIPHMTAFARRTLRQAFLTADMGISGVNFGVAETGSVCICTNEGNGRLTTTAPRIHVALMGIERIVPTPADLTVLLNLLARSGTGQALTVYTNILTGPRVRDAAAEDDGPDELHVLLVDNGRSRVLSGELAEILYCIRCGACLNACPVYRQIGGHAYGSVYQGPVGAVLSPALFGGSEWNALPQASSLCGACRDVCPVRIDIPRMLLALRRPAAGTSGTPAWLRFGIRMYRWAATHPRAFRAAGRLGGRVARLRADGGWIDRLPGPLEGWTRYRDFPAPPSQSFSARWRARKRH
jgi:L-lactate dehydrogenase complex protein LldF